MKHNREAIIFGIYCAALLIQNILALKSIDVFMFTVTTGVLVSPIVFMAQDVQSEIYGFARARKMILLGYLMCFVFVILATAAIAIPASDSYMNQEAFSTVFSTTVRITFASFIAYVTGSLVNAKLMTMNREKRGLFFRAITSTMAGQLLDNAIFAVIAFAGVLPVPVLISMMIGGTLFEVIYEIIFFPITRAIINRMKR